MALTPEEVKEYLERVVNSGRAMNIDSNLPGEMTAEIHEGGVLHLHHNDADAGRVETFTISVRAGKTAEE